MDDKYRSRGNRPRSEFLGYIRMFVSGALGSLGSLWVHGLKPFPWMMPSIPHYGSYIAGFIVMGGAVACVWNDDHLLRSFIVGISWPTLVSTFSRL